MALLPHMPHMLPFVLRQHFRDDFLDPDGSVAFRIHYQDAASNAPLGYPPTLHGDAERSADVAILCAASFSQVKGYPEGILRAVDARYIVLGHWENFFVSQEEPPRPVALTDVEELVARIEHVLPDSARWVLPKPHAVLQIAQCAR